MTQETLIETGISAKHMDMIQQILKSFPEVSRAWIYGSRARGTWTSRSDVDIAVSGAELSFRQFLALCNAFQDSYLPWLIDVLHIETTEEPNILAEIERDKVEIL